PPPFGPGSLVTMPLSKDVALVSSYSGASFVAMDVNLECVASLNQMTACRATKRLFSHEKDFTIELPDSSIGKRADLVRSVLARPPSGEDPWGRTARRPA